jgi:hypothetical protein
MTTIKLHPPKELPEEGITAVAFEAWRNQVLSFLEQELINSEFISGLYATWHAKNTATNGRRLSRLFVDDTDKIKLAAKHKDDKDDGTAKATAEAELLLKRNVQLTKCLQLVANLCQYSEQSDIMNSSTSFDWIWDHLCKHYNIESKGSHFLDVASMQPTPGQKPAVFYKRFRCGFLNNLRKKDEKIVYNNTKLSEDEKISPTFESAIMMWALEKLDARLPSKVQKDFGFRMEGNITLIDLQTAIFQAVPGMIQELDNGTELRAVQAEDEDAQLCAGGPRGGRGGGGGGANRFRGGRGGNRGSRQPFPISRPAGNVDMKKGCRVCRLAGKTEAVVNSHKMKECFFFTPQDHADFASLNMAELEQERDTSADSPYYDNGEED